MEELEIGTHDFTAPTDAHGYVLTHEWGGSNYVSAADLSDNFTFSISFESIGVYKLQWYGEAQIWDGTQELLGRPIFYNAYVPLFDSSQFLTENPALEDFEDFIPQVERKVRHIIQNYTGHKFGPYYGKYMDIQGDGGDSLYLPVPILLLRSIESNFGDDITDLVEISPNDNCILQRQSRFRGTQYYEIKRDVFWNQYEMFNERYNFTIYGDWGFEYVPQEVTEAAQILAAEALGSDEIADMKSKGIFQLQLGDFQIRLNADQWGTTGNATADNLLASYVNMGIGLI